MIWTAQFWKGAGERAFKTLIQTFLAVFGVQVGVVISGTDFVSLPWQTSIVTAGVAAFLSVLTSVGNADFTSGLVDVSAQLLNGPSQGFKAYTTDGDGGAEGRENGDVPPPYTAALDFSQLTPDDIDALAEEYERQIDEANAGLDADKQDEILGT